MVGSGNGYFTTMDRYIIYPIQSKITEIIIQQLAKSTKFVLDTNKLCKMTYLILHCFCVYFIHDLPCQNYIFVQFSLILVSGCTQDGWSSMCLHFTTKVTKLSIVPIVDGVLIDQHAGWSVKLYALPLTEMWSNPYYWDSRCCLRAGHMGESASQRTQTYLGPTWAPFQYKYRHFQVWGFPC